MFYRKKPVVIEARIWDGSIECFDDLEDWAPSDTFRLFTDRGGELILEVETLEGTHKASKMDYVIKGIAGEYYPCKPDIFRATYEAVEDQ